MDVCKKLELKILKFDFFLFCIRKLESITPKCVLSWGGDKEGNGYAIGNRVNDTHNNKYGHFLQNCLHPF